MLWKDEHERGEELGEALKKTEPKVGGQKYTGLTKMKKKREDRVSTTGNSEH